ncbi:MAG: transposase [Proteobacteria bacterium]|nr:transposase [Pseudomonadota bacterium]
MARQWRIEYPGALYHVLSRGNGKRDIFLSDDDRHRFLALVEELSDRFDIEVFAYVLMSNHYHLLLKTIDANLSKAMQWLGTTYTRKFNINNYESGHLFQGRYKCIIVENDAYLLRLSCYIHRNPLRAGIVERLAEYKWSSYRYYAYKQKAPDWLKTKTILNQVSQADPHKAYRFKVQHYSDEEGSFLEDIKHGLIYGSQDFIKDIKSRFLDGRKDVELPQQNSLFRDIDIDSLLNNTSKILGLNIKSASEAKRISAGDKDKRDLLIYLLWKTGRFTNMEIGKRFGLTYSAVSQRVKMMNSRLPIEKVLRGQYLLLKSQVKV